MTENCLHCRKTVAYDITTSDPACPNCGWTKSAAQNYDERQNHFLTKYAVDIRVKAFGKLIINILLACLFGFLLYYQVGDAIKLSVNGRSAMASVVDYKYEQSRGRKGRVYRHHYHTLVYNGFSKKVDLGQSYQMGTRFSVIYLPSNPPTMKLADANISFWRLATRDHGALFLLFCFGITGFFIFNVAWHIRTLLTGVEVEVEENR
jgi:hypothetical protein